MNKRGYVRPGSQLVRIEGVISRCEAALRGEYGEPDDSERERQEKRLASAEQQMVDLMTWATQDSLPKK